MQNVTVLFNKFNNTTKEYGNDTELNF